MAMPSTELATAVPALDLSTTEIVKPPLFEAFCTTSFSACATPDTTKSAVEIAANFIDFDLPFADANSPTAVQV